MRIERFAVRGFRKLAGGVAIEGLEPGITAIVGDNEEGKSTLLKALQAAFFDRHGLTGKAVEYMAPFGAKGIRPVVEVGYESDGVSYRLEKAFARNPAASLEGGGQRWEADAAEDRLRELLGFSQPGRGAAKEEHRGLAGLLWVEQGRAFAPLGMNEDSQAALREAIEGEVGQVLGGDRGRALLGAVEQRAGGYYTATGRERAALGGPRKLVEKLEEESEEKEVALSEYDDKVERLRKLRGRLARYERDGSLAAARDEADEAGKAVRRLEAVEGRVGTAKARMREAETGAKAARAEEKQRTELVAEVSRVQGEAQESADALESLEDEKAGAERGLAGAEQRLDEANRRLHAAETDARSARRARERAETAAELQTLDGRLEQADALNDDLGRVRRTLAANPVNDDVMDRLRGLSSEQAEQRAALEAAAAALTFEPEGGMAVSLDGQTVDTARPVRVTESKRFHLQGFGAVEVTPGGQDIARLRAGLADLDSRLRSDLRALGFDGVAAAEAALRGKQKLQGRLDTLIGELKGVAPDGIDALRDFVRGKRETVAAAESGDSEAPDIESAQAAERTAEERQDDASRDAKEAVQDRDTAKVQHDRVRDRWVAADAQKRLQTEAADRQRTVLERERKEAPDETLSERAAAAGREHGDRKAEYEAAVAERDALAPDVLRLERERAQKAYGRLKEEKEAAEGDERSLAGELRGLGQNGLAEELERIRGELDIARADLARVENDARAWKLLRDTLREAEREAKETFLEPVRERLQPYLRMLFPETELRLNEADLEIVALRRGGVEEPFASLSIGAREQVAVLTRLALADLLREKGRPVALILDDPLVNSDDERFRRMQLALRKAAANLQIVILTCHEARYEALGAKTVRLADCRIDG